jgi:hypothetical protein
MKISIKVVTRPRSRLLPDRPWIRLLVIVVVVVIVAAAAWACYGPAAVLALFASGTGGGLLIRVAVRLTTEPST